MVVIPTVDVGDVKDVYRRESCCVKSLEDRNEDYIKKQLGVQDVQRGYS